MIANSIKFIFLCCTIQFIVNSGFETISDFHSIAIDLRAFFFLSLFIHSQCHIISNSSCISFDVIISICTCFIYSGPSRADYLGIDDKCKVPLGIAAGKKQQCILMRMDYKVKLPDHTFAVAEKHKLVPSVYAVRNIDAKDGVLSKL